METVDRTGTFLGSMWESKTNMAVTLLEAGLAKLQTSFGTDRIPDAHLLAQAEQSAKRQKLKVRIDCFSLVQFTTVLQRVNVMMLINFLCRYGRTLLKERKFPPVLLLTVGVSY